MLEELKDSLIEFEKPKEVFGTFKERAIAMLIDGLVLLPLVAADWLNKTGWKSQLILSLTFLAGIVYKSFSEYRFGATPGKMAMKLLVVNNQFEKASLPAILGRNIFDILARMFFFASTIMVYRSPAFTSVSTNAEFVALQKQVLDISTFLAIYMLLELVEIVFVLADKRKRALHDMIGGTLVIKKV